MKKCGSSESSKTLLNGIQYGSSWHGTVHFLSPGEPSGDRTMGVKEIASVAVENLLRRDRKVAPAFSKYI